MPLCEAVPFRVGLSPFSQGGVIVVDLPATITITVVRAISLASLRLNSV